MSAEEKILELVDVYKTFDDLTVLKGCNLRVKKKETVVLIGPSGSGSKICTGSPSKSGSAKWLVAPRKSISVK